MAKKKCVQCEILKEIAVNLHWAARRYADGRSSYVASMINESVRSLLTLGVKLHAGSDSTIWARDGFGRRYDGLSEAEATPGTPESRGEHYE